jgi:hypothetical protein
MPRLLKSQKNEVFRRIQAVGLSPADFRWMNLYEGAGERLTHLPSGFAFEFLGAVGADPNKAHWRPANGPYAVNYSPHRDSRTVAGYWLEWDEVLSGVETWLEALKREYEAPDLWEQLHQEGRLPVVKSGLDEKSTFTADEIARLQVSIDQLTSELRTNRDRLNLSPEEVEWLVGEFEDLRGLAKNSNKKQWRLALVGLIVGASFQIAYNPARTHQLIEMIGKAFDWLVEISYLLPH